jgi:hypothetical protein
VLLLHQSKRLGELEWGVFCKEDDLGIPHPIDHLDKLLFGLRGFGHGLVSGVGGADPGYLWTPLNDHLVDTNTTRKIQLFCDSFPLPPIPDQEGG